MTFLDKIKNFLKGKLTFKLPNEEKRIAIDPERNPVAPGRAPTWSRIFDTEHQIFFDILRDFYIRLYWERSRDKKETLGIFQKVLCSLLKSNWDFPVHLNLRFWRCIFFVWKCKHTEIEYLHRSGSGLWNKIVPKKVVNKKKVNISLRYSEHLPRRTRQMRSSFVVKSRSVQPVECLSFSL